MITLSKMVNMGNIAEKHQHVSIVLMSTLACRHQHVSGNLAQISTVPRPPMTNSLSVFYPARLTSFVKYFVKRRMDRQCDAYTVVQLACCQSQLAKYAVLFFTYSLQTIAYQLRKKCIKYKVSLFVCAQFLWNKVVCLKSHTIIQGLFQNHNLFVLKSRNIEWIHAAHRALSKGPKAHRSQTDLKMFFTPFLKS